MPFFYAAEYSQSLWREISIHTGTGCIWDNVAWAHLYQMLFSNSWKGKYYYFCCDTVFKFINPFLQFSASCQDTLLRELRWLTSFNSSCYAILTYFFPLQCTRDPFSPFSSWRGVIMVHLSVSKCQQCHTEPILYTFKICTDIPSSKCWRSSPAWPDWILPVDSQRISISSDKELCTKAWVWGGDH